MDVEYPALHVPPRDLPVPRSVSPEAQAFLGAGRFVEGVTLPPPDDLDAWRSFVAAARRPWPPWSLAPRASEPGGRTRPRGPVRLRHHPGRRRRRRPAPVPRHPRRWSHRRCGTAVPGDGDHRGHAHAGDDVGGRLPDAARSPLSGAARRLRRTPTARCSPSTGPRTSSSAGSPPGATSRPRSSCALATRASRCPPDSC